MSQNSSFEMPLVDFMDMNRDGMNDLVYVDPETKTLRVLFNQLED